MKRCPFCKAEIEDNARFCLYCMHPLDEKQPMSPPPKKKRWLLILGGILAAALILVLLVRCGGGRDNHSEPPGQTEETDIWEAESTVTPTEPPETEAGTTEFPTENLPEQPDEGVSQEIPDATDRQPSAQAGATTTPQQSAKPEPQQSAQSTTPTTQQSAQSTEPEPQQPAQSTKPTTQQSTQPAKPDTQQSARPTEPDTQQSARPTEPDTQQSARPTEPDTQQSARPTGPDTQQSAQSTQPAPTQPTQPTAQQATQPTEPTAQQTTPPTQPQATVSTEPTTPVVTACSHRYQRTASTPATCTAQGSETYTCSLCDHSYSNSIPMTGHDYQAATCVEPQICRHCGATDGEALGHSYQEGTCTRCGQADPLAPRCIYEYRPAQGGDQLPSGSWNPDTDVVITGVSITAPDGIYEIPSHIDGKRVVAIRPLAFSGTDARQVTLGENVIYVSQNAFSGCYNIEALYIRSHALFLSRSAFIPASSRSCTLNIYCSARCTVDDDLQGECYLKDIVRVYGGVFHEWNG